MPAATTQPTPRTAERRALQDSCLQMREQGMSFTQIGQIVGDTAARASAHARVALSRRNTVTRSFGVEIELKGLSCSAAARAISAAGITCYDESYNHLNRPHWKVITDASISGGCEVVSPILSGEDGLGQIQTVMTALRNAGATVDTACGMHVHVDARDLTGDEYVRTFAFYAERQDMMDLLVAPSRRNNTYCGKYDAATIARAKDEASTLDKGDAGYRYGQGNRYYTVNLCSYTTHGTIEFRQHQGTLNGTKAVAWVRLLLAIVVKVQAVAEETIARTDLGEMLAGLGLPADTVRYLNTRAERLAV